MPFSMKTLRFLLILALLAGICSCKGLSDLTFTLVQYNVGVFNKYEESSVDVIALVARELGADVMTLNEVDSCTTRTGQVDQLAAFAAEMDGWNHHYAGGSHESIRHLFHHVHGRIRNEQKNLGYAQRAFTPAADFHCPDAGLQNEVLELGR